VTGPAQLTSILDALLSGGVEFVLVGGLAAVAQGAPITTHDVDIVHGRSEANLDRLMAVLGKLNARYRGRGSARAVFQGTQFTTSGASGCTPQSIRCRPAWVMVAGGPRAR
jgi:hypothetical protein